MTGQLPAWYSITNKADAPTLVSIYDEIGFFGVSAGSFLAELAGITGDLDVHISSPGGDVFDAIAIFNTLKQRKGVVAITVDGIAASAASFIAQAASPGKLEMAPHSTMMIHDGFASGIGNAADMRELADMLDAASDNIAAIYAGRTGKPAAYWRGKMRATTWYTDREAVEDGLADRVTGQDGAANTWDLSIYDGARPANADGGKATPIGSGWVMDPDGKTRFDPDGDGDDDSTPEGDTDHDYFDADGKSIKPIPPCPTPPAGNNAKQGKSGKSGKGGGKGGNKLVNGGTVDNSDWVASKAWHNGTTAEDPEAFYRGICAGKKSGDPDTQDAWALPYKYHPDDPPNAAGVRNALARLSSTQGLINQTEAQETLEAAMKIINPDYQPDDAFDSGLLSAVFTSALRGATT
jgi:ATP-dependent protease ClpP protease subunit